MVFCKTETGSGTLVNFLFGCSLVGDVSVCFGVVVKSSLIDNTALYITIKVVTFTYVSVNFTFETNDCVSLAPEVNYACVLFTLW